MVRTRTPTVIRTVRELRETLDAHRAEGRRIGFVPTMGAFHEGHLSLMRLAGEDDHRVVVSLFVNPTQFAPTEDLSAYPRDEERDLRLAAGAGAEIVFAPTVEEMYPAGFGTTVTVTGPTGILEGAARPDHFAGVATVVTKLLNMVRPDRVVFGQKDAQQVAVIRRLMIDLDFDDVELVIGPIVREDDGLAMSSRNAYLGSDERRAATVLRRALDMAEAAYAGGERHPHTLEAVAMATLRDEPVCEPEYAAVVDPHTFTLIDHEIDGPALLCLSARVGPARLIDNADLTA